MAQANSKNSTSADSSRRGFLAQAAAVAAGGAALGAAFPLPSSAMTLPDPILAGIEAHKAAVAALRRVIDIHSDLDHELPIEKCLSTITAWKEEIVETDDPHWIEAERSLIRAYSVETDAACALVGIKPTTLAGVIALLRYANSADIDGQGWPDDLIANENETKPRSWHYFLIQMLADALDVMEAGVRS